MKFWEFWIDHPETQDGPVSLRRWLAWHIGNWFYDQSHRLQRWALDPDWREHDDGIPF